MKMKKNSKSVFSKLFLRKNKKAVTNDALNLKIDNFQGIGKRRRQEDSFYMADYSDKTAIGEKGFLAVVADGMGGMLNGAEMSAVVTSAAKEYYDNHLKGRPEHETEELISMLSFIDARAKQLQDCSEEDESGSTLLAALIRDNKMHFLTVGDSRIYLLRDGKLLQLNREHNVKSKMLERLAKNEIDMEFYQDITGKAGLTSYIGIPELKLYDLSVRPLLLKGGDVILLASDGVFGTLSDEDIIDILSADSDDTAKRMRSAIEEANSPRQDNYTGIIIRCKN